MDAPGQGRIPRLRCSRSGAHTSCRHRPSDVRQAVQAPEWRCLFKTHSVGPSCRESGQRTCLLQMAGASGSVQGKGPVRAAAWSCLVPARLPAWQGRRRQWKRRAQGTTVDRQPRREPYCPGRRNAPPCRGAVRDSRQLFARSVPSGIANLAPDRRYPATAGGHCTIRATVQTPGRKPLPHPPAPHSPCL